ncbi:MAG: urease accessory protein UreF [Microcoleaceae cyanobacterium]
MNSILRLLQLASPALPLGAYSYSEGLETLVEKAIIQTEHDLESWLIQALTHGTIRLDAAVMLRAFRCYSNQSYHNQNPSQLVDWNSWLSAAWETAELRQQSWQMGGSLMRLLLELDSINTAQELDSNVPSLKTYLTATGKPYNHAIVFGVAVADWQIDQQHGLLGYLQSWVSNLIGAGVKLIPLGQTSGQKILLKLQPVILNSAEQILRLEDSDLVSCSWGLGLASMAHETQYSRLFRS